MKQYIEPQIEFIRFNDEDVMYSSTHKGGGTSSPIWDPVSDLLGGY